MLRAAAFLLWAASAQANPAAFNAPLIPWQDLQTGLAEATDREVPVILVVHASWCPVCREYQGVFTDPGIVEAAEEFVWILLEQGVDPEAEDYRPDGAYIPRTMVLAGSGEVVDTIQSGWEEYRYFLDPADPADLLRVLDEARALE